MITKLKSYTIVPDNLYVERNADKQLHNIVEAMQRPGYVLVSRQMGKTNLLLRAKRKWESSDDLYVYIDMSNIDETEKECFESLIDTAIDTHEEILSPVRERIMDLRRTNITKSPVQAHNEELRVLLSAVKGKLVYILDEIDSLTRTSFSDNVFSQIRSVYFSRVNYPVLEKLTYVLSGVVEPTEIIKNPKISPFNIGEKILLDDFNYEEYLSFIKKADLLDFGEDVIQRIYYWASGNPRMTWDICYELQHFTEITPESVDFLVKEMYLTSFDKAPIDTIRNLVKEDRDLRDAIIQLAYEKGELLSDKIKRKLYLSGIVNYNDNNVRIKNRIIKESLTLNWLKKVAEEEKGLLSYAVELHSKGRYSESIEKFVNYLKNNNFPEGNESLYYYFMGSSYYHIEDFKQSLAYLTQKTIDPKTFPFEYRHENLLSGIDCIHLERYTDAIGFFEKAMAGDTNDILYYSAKLNSLIACERVYIGKEDKIEEIKKGYIDFLNLPDEKEYNELKLHAAFRLAGLYGMKEQQNACKAYDVALSYASDATKLRVLVEKYRVLPIDQRIAIIDEIITSVSIITEVERSLDPDRNMELDEDIFLNALYLVYYNSYERWNEIREKVSLLPYSYGDTLYKMFMLSDLEENGASRLIKELHDNISSIKSAEYNISTNYILHIYKYNAYLNDSIEYINEYLKEFHKTNDQIDSIGLVIVCSFAWKLLEKKDYVSIISVLGWITERYPSIFSYQDMYARALFEYCLLVSYYYFSIEKSAIEMSNLILSYIDEAIAGANERNKMTLERIKNEAQMTRSIIAQNNSEQSPKSFGRNDRVKVKYIQSGNVVVKKYKSIESDLKKGLCVIVEE